MRLKNIISGIFLSLICFVGYGQTVTSILRVDSSPTNASTIRWDVTFSQDITNVDVADFTLITGGTASGVISNVSVKTINSVWTVTVNTVAGNGSLQLQMLGGAATSPMLSGLPFDGDVYTIDNTAPTNENTVYASSDREQGGVAVTIVSSGVATNEVWFAPSGTSVFSTGATMTQAGSGTATSILSPANEGAYKLYVLDLAGNISSESIATLTVDNTAPSVTNVSIPNSPMKVGSTVTATITVADDGGDIPTLTSGTIGGFTLGSFVRTNSTTYTAQFTVTEGGTDYAAGADIPVANLVFTDVAGNANLAYSQNISQGGDLLDANTPAAPGTIVLDSGSDNGTSNSDRVTNDATPLITGTAEAGSTISLTSDKDGAVGTGTATGGNYSITTNALSEDTHIITATSTDAAGNVSSGTSLGSMVIDLTVPTNQNAVFTTSSREQGGQSVTIVSSGVATNEVWFAPSGTSVFSAGATMTKATSGTATSILSPANEGTYKLYVLDLAGNISSESTATLTVDNTPPSQPTSPDLDASTDSGNSDSDNITNKLRPLFKGAVGGAEANSTITISDQGGVIGTTTAAGDGSWSHTLLSDISTGDRNITITATDAAGNESIASSALAVTFDNTALAPFVITPIEGDNIVNDSEKADVLVAGTSENNATIDISFVNGETVTRQVIADASGNWTISGNEVNLSTLGEGAISVSITQTDVAGNLSPIASPTLIKDTEVNAPVIGTPIAVDNIINASEVTAVLVQGSGAENGATVTVSFDGSALISKNTTANASGDWSLSEDISGLTDGNIEIRASQTDPGGNVSVETKVNVTKDATSPTVPTTPDLVSESDSGISDTDNETNDRTPAFKGSGEAGTSIRLEDAGSVVYATTTVNGSGDYNLVTTRLSDGMYDFNVISTDAAGNESNSASLTVTIDSVASGKPSAAPDLMAGSDSGVDSDNKTNVLTPSFEGANGSVGSNEKVILYADGAEVGTTTADAFGAYTVSSSSLKDGTYSFTITSVDVAGNETEPSDGLSVEIDTAKPSGYVVTIDQASINDLNKNALSFTFTGAEVISGTNYDYSISSSGGGTTVSNTGSVASSNASVSGIDVSGLGDGDLTLTVYMTDVEGNQGDDVTATVVKDVAPPSVSAPDLTSDSDSGSSDSDNYTNDATPTFVGTAEADANIVLKAGATVVGTTTASGGNYTVTSSNLIDGTYAMTVEATDASGNTSISGTLSVTIDTASPSQPGIIDLVTSSDSGDNTSDDLTNDDTPEFNGTVENNSIVKLYAGNIEVGSLSLSGTGTYNLSSTSLSDGVYDMTVTATDLAGNVSLASTALSVTIDKTKPSGFDVSIDQAQINLANNTAMSFTFNNAQNPSKYEYEVEDISADKVVGIGTISDVSQQITGINVSTLDDGVLTLRVSLEDAAGNVSDIITKTIQKDASVPSSVSIPNLIDINDSGESNSDNITNVRTLTFIGTAEPNTDIKIKEGNNVIGIGQANAAGNYSIACSSLVDGAYSITATSIDAADNELQSAALSVTVDGTAPSKPGSKPDLVIASDSGIDNDDKTNDATPSFSGANATVGNDEKVILYADGIEVGTTTADGNGAYTVSSSSLKDGTYSFTITSVDVAGNESVASDGLSVEIDTSKPLGYSVNIDQVNINDANQTALSFTFSGAETTAGTTYNYDISSSGGGSSVSSSGTAASSNANVSGIDVSGLNDGDLTLTVYMTDIEGNQGDNVIAKVVKDVGFPSVSDPDLTSDSDSGTSNSDNYTNDVTPSFTGTAESGASIVLKAGTTVVGTTVATGGNYLVTSSNLAEGSHAITVEATDSRGNTSTSGILNITIDTSSPAQPGSTDLVISSDSGESDSDNLTNDDTPEFTGAVEDDSIVKLYAEGVEVGSVSLSGTGSYNLSSTSLSDGIYDITVTATDLAGNVSLASTALSVIIDKTVPSGFDLSIDQAQINLANNTAMSFTFNGAEAQTKYYYVVTDVATATVSSNGTVTSSSQNIGPINVSGLADGNLKLDVYLVDKAGNISATITRNILKDASLPSAVSVPDLLAIDDKGASNSDNRTNLLSLTFIGTAEPNTTIEIKEGVNIVGRGVADVAGNYSVPCVFGAEGTYSVTATSIDASNNELQSGAMTVIIDTSVPAKPASVIDLTTDSGVSPTDNITSDNTPSFIGADVEANSEIKLLINGVENTSATANGSGLYSFTLGVLPDGVYSVRVTSTDLAGNTSVMSDPINVVIDTDAPGLDVVGISSSNSNIRLAKVADKVSLHFTSDEEITNVSAQVGGQNANAPIKISGNNWKAERNIDGTETEGFLGFSITYEDLAGNTSTTTAVTDGSSVTFDQSVPLISSTTIPSGNYKIGDKPAVTITGGGADYDLVSATVNGKSVSFVNNANNTYSFVYTIEEGDVDQKSQTSIPVNIQLVDPSGNLSSVITSASVIGGIGKITIDANSPKVLGASTPNAPSKIGESIVVTFSIEDKNQTSTYNLISAKLGGYVFNSYTEQSATEYTVSFPVTEGGIEYLAASDIILSEVVFEDELGQRNIPYNLTISQDKDAIYSIRPKGSTSGTSTICAGKQTQLSIQLTGHGPWTFSYTNGISPVTVTDYANPLYETMVTEGGTYSLTSVTDMTGNLATSFGTTATVSVNPLPIVDFSIVTSSNLGDDAIKMTGIKPWGGTFSGPGVVAIDSTFHPKIAGLGEHKIKYEYTDPTTGCTDSLSKKTTVLDAQGGIFTVEPVYCWEDKVYTFEGKTDPFLGEIGVFSNSKGKGLTTISNNVAEYNPSIAGAGNDTIFFVYSGGGATFTIKEPVYIDSIGNVNVTGFDKNWYCTNDAIIDLAALPYNKGGFTGAGINGDRFDPTEAGVGKHTITYTYTSKVDNSTCKEEVINIIDVFQHSEVHFKYIDSCAVEGTPVQFVNNSTLKANISTWDWDFGDNTTTEDKSNLEAPAYQYSDVAYEKYDEFTVSLKVTTNDGCITIKDSTMTLGIASEALFTWQNECQGKEVDFVASDGGGRIEEYEWFFGDGSTEKSTSKLANHNYGDIQSYDVRLVVRNKFNCISDSVRTLNVRETVVLQDQPSQIYSEDFSADKTGWYAETLTPSEENSWSLGESNQTNLQWSGFKAWYTENKNTVGEWENESSWVSSPCFDFTNVERPMFKMDILTDFKPNVTGSILQYSVDNGNTWNIIGSTDNGINWYNSDEVSSKPAGSVEAWSDTLRNWTEVRNTLDGVIGNNNVRFRILYGTSDNQFGDSEGIAFKNIWIGERSRNVLIENFTNYNATGGESSLNKLKTYMETTGSKDYVDIQYHSDDDNSDEDKLNKDNVADAAVRKYYYSVKDIPYVIADGNKTNGFNLTALNGSAWQDSLLNQALLDPKFAIDFNLAIDGKNLTVAGTYRSLMDITTQTELQLNIVIVEEEVTGVEGTSLNFRNVMRKLLPDGAGIRTNKSWTAGVASEESFSQTWEIENYVNSGNLKAIVFVQNVETFEVYQTEVKGAAYTSSIDDLFIDNKEIVALFPNPASEEFTLAFDKRLKGEVTIRVLNTNGTVVKEQVTGILDQHIKIQSSDLETGIYFVQVISDGAVVFTERLSIQN